MVNMYDRICFLFCYCVVNSIITNALSAELDILKELKLIKEQLGNVLVENEILRQRTYQLEQKTMHLEQTVEQLTLEKNQRRPLQYESHEATENYTEDTPPAISRADDVHIDSVMLRDKSQVRDHLKVSVGDPRLIQPYLKDREKRLILPASTEVPTTQHGVAFSARVNRTISNLKDNQDIPFDDVVIDTNQAYHGPTGIFTCPQDGVYAFQATILVFSGKLVQFEIVKEGAFFAAGYSYGALPAYGTGSTSGIVHLQKGNRVWVKIHGGSHSGTGRMINEIYSSFMGFSVMLQ